MDWLPVCVWPDVPPSPAQYFADGAQVLANTGAKDLARDGLLLAGKAAVQESDLVRKLIDIACVAEAQAKDGWPDDSHRTLRSGVEAAQAHWDDSQPQSVYTPTVRLLALAHLHHESGFASQARQSVEFIAGKLRTSEPGLDRAFATIKLAQFHHVRGDSDAADDAFALARHLLLDVSAQRSAVKQEDQDEKGPPAALSLAMLAQEQAKVGRVDEARADFARAKTAGLPHSSELSENLMRMETELENIIANAASE